MVKEISRSSWSKFCKNFSATNQYRLANVSIIDRSKGESRLFNELALLGIGLEKKGKTIDGVQLFAGRWDPEKMLEPVMSIKQPTKIVVDQDDRGFDRMLRVQAKDGTEARIELYGEKNPEKLVEKVAYSIFEKRGYAYGDDMHDWLEAEKIVREAEEQLT
jgi:Protein of unknown function (DUF2934)